MKKFLTCILTLLIAIGCFSGCGDSDKPSVNSEPSLSINRESLTISVGQYEQLDVNLKGVKGPVEWSSSNEKVVSIDDNGLIKALDFGEAEIIAKSGNYSDFCKVFVLGTAYSPVLNIDRTAVSVYVGETFEVNACVMVNDQIVLDEIQWISSDISVAAVTNGVIMGVKDGNAIITAKANYGGEELIEEILVTVYSGNTFFINQNAVRLAVVQINDEDTFTELTTSAFTNGERDLDGDVSWSVEDKDVLTVDQNGNATAVSAGKTIVTATFTKGNEIRTAWTEIEVYKATVKQIKNLGKLEVKSDDTVSFSLSELGYSGQENEEVIFTFSKNSYSGKIKGGAIVIDTDGTIYGDEEITIEVRDRKFIADATVNAKLVSYKINRYVQKDLGEYKLDRTENAAQYFDKNLNDVYLYYDDYLLNSERTGKLEVKPDGSSEIDLYYDKAIVIGGASGVYLFAIDGLNNIGNDGVLIKSGMSYGGKDGVYQVTNVINRTYIQIVGTDTASMLSAGKTKLCFDICYKGNVVMNIANDEHASGKLISLHMPTEVKLHSALSIKNMSGTAINAVPSNQWSTVEVDLTSGVQSEVEGISSMFISLACSEGASFYLTNVKFA